MWVLVIIILHFGPDRPTFGIVGKYATMAECFIAREHVKDKWAKRGIRASQAVCVDITR